MRAGVTACGVRSQPFWLRQQKKVCPLLSNDGASAFALTRSTNLWAGSGMVYMRMSLPRFLISRMLYPSERRRTMKIRELIPTLQAMDPDGGVFVVLAKPDGTSEIFEVEAVRDDQGNAHIEVHEKMLPTR
jgi:hypothetical protein